MVVLALESRKLRQISNFHNGAAPLYGDTLQAQAYAAKYPFAVHRPTAVCYTYNCHGLTFASRRSEITSPAEVRQILIEDDYSQIDDIKHVLPGDVAIYIAADNDIEHSGIVVEIPNFAGMISVNPIILSKWGSAHEVIHKVRECPYASSRIEYYRVIK